ncbi:MAG TPA: hypothetical protein VFP71_03150 [Candidatus Angelobacter sp.]|nr:hypothetical protein [Candidatus Angelobacter sp.]
MIDAKTDLITKTIAVNSPGKLVSAGGVTLIQSTLSSTVVIFDNSTETIRFTVALPALAVDIALTPDGKTAWVAENNGTVQSINTATGVISTTTTEASVQRLFLGSQGLVLLPLNDGLTGSFPVIATQTTNATTVTSTNLDHPANAVFIPGNDSQFFVLNCGVECGGTQAGIVGITNGTGTPTITSPLSLSGATTALLGGSTIFVAGSPTTGLNAGTLQTIDTGLAAASTAVKIADGRHNLMALTSNGRLYIGSTGCTAGAVNAQNQRQGCLTIFDTTTQIATPVLVPANRTTLDVTGLAPVAGRNVIYVIQGGVLDIFDITTNAVSTTATPPNITGTAFGVVQLSP